MNLDFISNGLGISENPEFFYRFRPNTAIFPLAADYGLLVV
jgi:hypothetical protein